MKRISNYQLRESLKNEYRTAFSGRYSLFFDAIWRYTWRALPLGVKFLVRKNIGSMTFSWGMIFFAAVWARFLLEGYPSVDESSNFGSLAKTWDYFQEYGIVFKVLGIFFAGLMKFLFCIVDFIPFSIFNNEALADNPEYLYPFFVSVLVLLLGAIRKEEISKKHRLKIPFDPLYHGDSIFVLGFLEIASIFHISEAIKQEILEKQRIIEVVILGALAYVSWLLGQEWIFLDLISKFLLVGTIALILENWSIKRQLQREIEAQLAMDYRTKKIQEAYERYHKKDEDKIATVSPVSSYEMDRMSLHPITPKGATVNSE